MIILIIMTMGNNSRKGIKTFSSKETFLYQVLNPAEKIEYLILNLGLNNFPMREAFATHFKIKFGQLRLRLNRSPPTPAAPGFPQLVLTFSVVAFSGYTHLIIYPYCMY
jgi:hypothetical protein